MACASALLIFAIYPGAVEATIIKDDSLQVSLDAQDLFLFQPALLRTGSNPDACTLASLQAGTGVRNGDSLPWFETLGESSNLNRMALESSNISLGTRLSKSDIAELKRIKTRISNMANCLKYMQYLLNTIESIFNIAPNITITSVDRNFESQPASLVFLKAGESAANSSDSAIGFSKSTPESRYLKTHTTMLSAPRSTLTRSPKSRAKASSAKRTNTWGALTGKINIKEFVINTFMNIYMYVLLISVYISFLFIKKWA